jgi:hypothetical protein
MNLETMNLETMNLETMNLETMNLETMNLETMNRGAINDEKSPLPLAAQLAHPKNRLPTNRNGAHRNSA